MSSPHQHAVAAESIFDGSVVHRHTAVLITGKRIAGIRPRSALPKHVPVHELPKGCWLAPGFIDVPVNGGGGVLFYGSPNGAAINRILADHRRFRTTGLLPTLISDTAETIHAAVEVVQDHSLHKCVRGIQFE